MAKTRTITLTGRPPVRIRPEDWPLIASASDEDYEGQVKCQSFRTSDWFLGVRQHADGRAIVYTRYSYDTAWQHERSLSAARGVTLPAGSEVMELVRAIQEVTEDIAACEHSGEDASRWLALRDECIAGLPAEVLE